MPAGIAGASTPTLQLRGGAVTFARWRHDPRCLLVAPVVGGCSCRPVLTPVQPDEFEHLASGMNRRARRAAERALRRPPRRTGVA